MAGAPAPNTASASSVGTSKRSTGRFWLDDPGHLLLDARQVGLGDGRGELEVVVEAVLDGGADGVLRAREEAQDSLRHDVRRGVAQHIDGVRVVALEGDDGDAVALVKRGADVDQ